MSGPPKHILIISDIEGSSRCRCYQASAFMDAGWPEACLGMTRDVHAVVSALFQSGVEQVTVKDFHRTGYNLLPEKIDPRARLVQGYRQGPIPGIGDPGSADAAMFLGMHAASGTGGFLAHTLTSRIGRLEVNGVPLTEVQLFSASLSPYQIRPLFFSGCPIACRQAEHAIGGIHTFPISKPDVSGRLAIRGWRRQLAAEAVSALSNRSAVPYDPTGPFVVRVSLREGQEAARKIALRWQLDRSGADLFFKAIDTAELYHALIRICYLTPVTERLLPIALPLFNLRGRLGLMWVRHRLRHRFIRHAGHHM